MENLLKMKVKIKFQKKRFGIKESRKNREKITVEELPPETENCLLESRAIYQTR